MNIESLIGQIYDCVEDENQWPEVLQSLFSGFGCSGASWQNYSPVTNETCFSHAIGFDQSWTDEYLSVWRDNDAFANALTNHILSMPPVGRKFPVRADFYFGADGYKKTDVYQNFMREWDFDDYMVLPLDMDDNLAGIGLWCGSRLGRFSDRMFKAAQMLTPHLLRAKRISNKLAYANAYLSVGEAGVSADACIIIDQHLNCLDHNQSAEGLFENEEVLRRKGNQITFSGDGVDAHMGQCLKNLSNSDGRDAGFPRMSEIALAQGTMVLIYQLPIGSVRKKMHNLRSEFLVVIKQSLPFYSVAANKLSRKYKLTHAEESIASSLVVGLSLAEISELRKTKISTTRWHMKQLFTKFDVSSQRELLRKLLLH